MQALTDGQKLFFEEFGYLVLPGAVKDDVATIIDEFEKVFAEKGIDHDPTKRTCFVPFIDQRAKLSALLDHPVILGIAKSLLGDDFNYIGSDGNYYTGDTSWHTDGWHSTGKYIKIAFYLDPVARETGALRVIPSSHRVKPDGESYVRGAWNAPESYGIDARDVPCQALETQPGDLAVFNHNMFHSAFGGSSRRRMFTINLCDHADSAAEIEDLRNFIGGGARFWIDEPFSKQMVETANEERMRHLQQVINNSDHLPALAAQARATMSEPSRG